MVISLSSCYPFCGVAGFLELFCFDFLTEVVDGETMRIFRFFFFLWNIIRIYEAGYVIFLLMFKKKLFILSFYKYLT